MAPGSQADSPNGAHAIDPISRQILQRTVTTHKLPQNPNGVPTSIITTARDEEPDPRSPDAEALRRVDTGLSKKKGVSFLSRIMGGKKKDDSIDVRDSVSEICEDRSGGNDAEVFSHPVGYIPKFPAPPRYIRVKAQNRKKRDLDRLFLAQILLDPQPLSRRRSSNEIDGKIVNIGDTPTVAPPNSSRKLNNATWASEFSKDGKYFAAAGQDRKLRVWEVISAKETREGGEDQSQSGSENEQGVKLDAPVFKQRLIREYDGHTAAILDLSWSKNNFLLTSSMDKSVRLYHVSREECLCSFKHNDFVTSIQFHPRDDRFFLAGSLDSKLRLWSIPDKSVAYWTQVPDMITAVAFTPDGRTAIAGCLSGVCILYNTEGLKAHSQIHVRSSRGRNTKGSKITGIDTISIPRDNGVADVKLLITSNDSRIRMYNLKDRALEMKFRGNENSCSQIRATFSDDGMFVICGSEDRKVYVWPTGPVEKADMDKRPVEIFEAHSQIVTTAVFAPTATRRVLAQSGDPIYDLCNPPPVVLLSRNGSVLSSPANTQRSGSEDQKQATPVEKESIQKQLESPAYQARQSHIRGHIIVTADYSGQIKVFRQDCAYQKRRDSTWDSGSALSRKMTMLGRSGSITTRGSRRNSMNTAPKQTPSTDHILSWRNSIASNPSMNNSFSDFGFKKATSERDRSSSPKKSLSKRLSLSYNSTPLASAISPPSSPEKARQPSGTPDITLQSPNSTHSHTIQAGSEPHDSGSEKAHPARIYQHDSPPKFITFKDRTQATNDNPLALIGDHSYKAWDTRHTIAPMATRPARSPNAHKESRNPISRTQSIVSQLTSEGASSLSDEADGKHEATARKSSVVTAGASTDDEELKCARCGGEKFKVVKASHGGKGLKCRDCNMIV